MNIIDVFAHILTPGFYADMLEIEPNIPQLAPYTRVEPLINLENRRQHMEEFPRVKQVISMINLNPEDFTNDPEKCFQLCWKANEELAQTVQQNPELFVGAAAMLPMNNMAGAERILREQVTAHPELLGAQIFTTALGEPIASQHYRTVFTLSHQLGTLLWLHPVFDPKKHDNNLVFSWEYELSQAMLGIIQAGIFDTYPDIKIIVHHAGAMVPFFSHRLPLVMPPQQAEQFKLFYVDTAIIGNTAAVEMAVNYYGADRVLFGTDAPVGVKPAGPTAVVLQSIAEGNFSQQTRNKIYRDNWQRLLRTQNKEPQD